MKDIVGYEGKYAATRDGRIYSYNKKIYLKSYRMSNGYHQITLYDFNRMPNKYLLHRLIASTFISNEDNLPQVGHMDDNPSNNSVDNIYWTTQMENNHHGDRIERIAKANSKRPVFCIELNKEFISASAASRELGVDRTGIWKCCNGLANTAGKYHWRYANE